jgi:hypothetical protein
VKDGSPVAPWEQLPAAGGPPVFRVSPRKESLAVLRPQAANKSQADALVYAVRGDGLVPTGQVIDLPVAGRFQPADDGRSIVETRRATRARRGGRFVWPVTAGRTPVSPRPARSVEVAKITPSPGGGFEVQEESKENEGVLTLRVVRRADRAILNRFASGSLRYRFSSDDRWLGVWSDDAVQVLDLARNEIVLRLTPGEVEDVTFEARNTILNVRLDDGATLIPLDRTLVEQFAKWLAPRVLTPGERCTYGLGGDACPREVVAR